MMTPKEKAIELHNKILNVTFDDRDIPGEPTWVSTRCALIAVDEIMLNEKINHSSLDKTYEYWEEVKKEIELL